MAKGTLVGKVKKVVREVGVPVAAQLARGAVKAVGAVAEVEGRVEAELRKRVQARGPEVKAKARELTQPVVRTVQKAKAQTRSSRKAGMAEARVGRKNRPLVAAAKRVRSPAVKVKRGQKHRHSR